MLLLEVDPIVTPIDDKTNLIFSLTVPPKCEAVKIIFSYAPAFATAQEARKALLRALPMYFTENQLEKLSVKQFLPLSNLITVSCRSQSHGYLGCHHTKEVQQEIIIGPHSSRGFLPVQKLTGALEIMLNVHAAISSSIQVHLLVQSWKER